MKPSVSGVAACMYAKPPGVDLYEFMYVHGAVLSAVLFLHHGAHARAALIPNQANLSSRCARRSTSPCTFGGGHAHAKHTCVCLAVYHTLPPHTHSLPAGTHGVFGWVASSAYAPWVVYLALGPGLVGHTGFNALLKYLTPLVRRGTSVHSAASWPGHGWLAA